jgi:hypothetical protein
LVYGKMLTDHGMPYLEKTTLAIGVSFLGLLLLSDFRDEYFKERFKFFDNEKFIIRFASYLAVFFLIIIFGVVSNKFIYFQF